MKIVLIGFWILWISGCSSMYVAKESDEPHGYSEVKLDETSYLVSYQTYKSVSYDEMFEYVTQRSAELALLEGYEDFNLSNRQDETIIELIEMPLVTTTSTQANFLPNGMTVMSSHVDVASPGYTREIKIKKTSAKITLVKEETIGMRLNTTEVLAQ